LEGELSPSKRRKFDFFFMNGSIFTRQKGLPIVHWHGYQTTPLAARPNGIFRPYAFSYSSDINLGRQRYEDIMSAFSMHLGKPWLVSDLDYAGAVSRLKMGGASDRGPYQP
jgi:hypothetical protein